MMMIDELSQNTHEQKYVTSSSMLWLRNWTFDKQAKPKIARGLTVRVSVLTRNTQNWKLGAPPSQGQQKSKYTWKMKTQGHSDNSGQLT